MFKHGVAFFTLKGIIDGNATISLEFKKKEMNDVLKSLLVLDLSGTGYVSSISYDADQDINRILEDIAIGVESKGSFLSLLENFKGAVINLLVGGKELSGKIMGIQEYEIIGDSQSIMKPALVILNREGIIIQINFTDIKSLKLEDPVLQKDLEFYLSTMISGKKKDAKRIFINCEGEGKRDILTRYIIESPVWKTSYRIIIPEEITGQSRGNSKESCFLSGWCLVENTTEQDWDEIQLSLVAGMPVSFICPIYPPMYVSRPRVEPPKVAQIGPADIDDEVEEVMYDMMPKMKKHARSPPPPPGAAPAAPSGMAALVKTSRPRRSMKAFMKQAKETTSVSTKDMGELFEYKIAKPVTIKRKKSALVPIVSKDIEASKILLYEEGQHPKNPMACLEIKNTSGVTLEQGPVTIFYEENLAGEAMLPFLNQDEVRILSYALEQGVAIEKDIDSWSKNIHKVLFNGGYSYEYYYRERKTTYKINNKTNRSFSLYIDHPKSAGYELHGMDIKPTDTPNFHRFKVSLDKKKAIKLEVKEREETYSSVHIWDMNKKNLLEKVTFYIKHDWIDKKKEGMLHDIAEQLESLQKGRGEQSDLESEKSSIFSEQNRLRQNIKSMSTSSSERNLRQKYVKKLDDQETRLEEIEKRLKEVKITLDEISENISTLLEGLEQDE
ncbi:MAG: hypothetical protein ACTSUE_25450 [Promethearchaeota archaeon]